MGALISYENLADGATLTDNSDGTQVIAAAAVQTRQLGDVMRRILGSSEELILDFDLGSAQSIRYVGIFNHNIPAGDYTVDLGTTAGASDVASETGTLWQGVSDSPKQQHVIFDATYSAQHVRVTLSPDAAQTVDLGRIWIDEPWAPSVGLDYRATVQDPSVNQRTIAQSVYSYRKARFRKIECVLNNMRETDALGSSSDVTARGAAHMDFTVGISSPIVLIPQTTGADADQVIHQFGIYGHIETSSPIRLMESKDGGGWRYTKAFTVCEER